MPSARNFCLSAKTGNGSDIQEPFDHIVAKPKTQMPVPALLFNGDPSHSLRHDDAFMWRADPYRDDWRNLDDPPNSTQCTVRI
jgi:hypothetical protein